MKVDLVYDPDCPNVVEARTNLLVALQRAGLPTRWTEWDALSPDTAPAFRGHGSPAILVDGCDVGASSFASDSECCRLYPRAGGTAAGAPSVDSIVAALKHAGAGRADQDGAPAGRGTFAAMLPAAGFGLLPKLACPACWPAYAGLLGSLGLGFLMETAYLLPLTAGFLLLALAALGFRARRRATGPGPLVIGLLAAAAILGGKFALDSDPIVYAGVALLIIASAWNAVPDRFARLFDKGMAALKAAPLISRQRFMRKEGA